MSTATTKVEKVLAVQPVRPIARVEKYIKKDTKYPKKGGKKEVGFNTVLKEKLSEPIVKANNSEACDELLYNSHARVVPYAKTDKFNTKG